MKKIIGDWGENQACLFLLRRGYVITQTNFYSNKGEIDIIAEKIDTISNKELIFIEVKTRKYQTFVTNSAELATDYYKFERIKKTAKYYCIKYNVNLDRVSIMFKQISVYIYGKKVRLVMYDLE